MQGGPHLLCTRGLTPGNSSGFSNLRNKSLAFSGQEEFVPSQKRPYLRSVAEMAIGFASSLNGEHVPIILRASIYFPTASPMRRSYVLKGWRSHARMLRASQFTMGPSTLFANL